MGLWRQNRVINGSQYSSLEFAHFVNSYEFNYITSSPRFPQSNGQVECAVKTVKQMLPKSPDSYVALLSYRTTPSHRVVIACRAITGEKAETPYSSVGQISNPRMALLRDVSFKEHEIKERQPCNFN